MTSAKWAAATALFNTRLKAELPGILPKMPRALSEAFAKLEATILRRLKQKDYKAKSGKEDFWRKHCYAVMKLLTNNGYVINANGEAELDKKLRKIQVCSRCNRDKYPNGVGGFGNHPKHQCDDNIRNMGLEPRSTMVNQRESG
ncbi:hypothetical protein BDZ89DRAFT_712694 [Hymenopellis radicata]|nr:hypothetical protein BDZ89DRAFT_712694 [Hymenopellis radicata]